MNDKLHATELSYFDLASEVARANEAYFRPVEPCWNCGTSSDRFTLCVGCASAYREQARAERDRSDDE